MKEPIDKFIVKLQEENADKINAIRDLQAILEKLVPSEDVIYVYQCKIVSNS